MAADAPGDRPSGAAARPADALGRPHRSYGSRGRRGVRRRTGGVQGRRGRELDRDPGVRTHPHQLLLLPRGTRSHAAHPGDRLPAVRLSAARHPVRHGTRRLPTGHLGRLGVRRDQPRHHRIADHPASAARTHRRAARRIGSHRTVGRRPVRLRWVARRRVLRRRPSHQPVVRRPMGSRRARRCRVLRRRPNRRAVGRRPVRFRRVQRWSCQPQPNRHLVVRRLVPFRRVARRIVRPRPLRRPATVCRPTDRRPACPLPMDPRHGLSSAPRAFVVGHVRPAQPRAGVASAGRHVCPRPRCRAPAVRRATGPTPPSPARHGPARGRRSSACELRAPAPPPRRARSQAPDRGPGSAAVARSASPVDSERASIRRLTSRISSNSAASAPTR